MRRRRLLGNLGVAAGTVGLGSLAGCMRGPGPRAADDPWRERTEEELDSGYRIQGRVVLTRGEYVAVPFETPGDGPAILAAFGRTRLTLPMDAFTFTPDAFDSYRSGDASEFLSSGTTLDSTSLFMDGRVQAGEYVFVIDNTRLGGARPLDEIDVTFSFELTA